MQSYFPLQCLFGKVKWNYLGIVNNKQNLIVGYTVFRTTQKYNIVI